MHTNGLKLPACERCRVRKSRCDGASPKCTSCQKSNSACIIVDSASQEKFSRDAIHELELRLQELEKRRVVGVQSSPVVVSPSSTTTRRRQQAPYVGDGSGLNLFSEVSRNAGGHHERVELLRQPNVTSPSVQRQANLYPLPPYDHATSLLDRYFSHSHLHHPFLASRDVDEALQRVYSRSAEQKPDDTYRLFMIFAISTVTSFRKGETHLNPYGYYHAAQAASGGVHLDGTTRSIQNILLTARFAMYYHIDCSIWDLSRLCMRQCIELGLHSPPTKAINPLEEQLNRYIFWDCYVHDRYSSGIMGRPYAISEKDITVQLPVPMSEQDIMLQPINILQEIDLDTIAPSNNACVSLFVISLRRITTQIQIEFFGSKAHTLPAHRTIREAAMIQNEFDQFWAALDRCLAEAPQFEQVQSLYQRPQWYDFMVEKDRLLLIRGMMSKQHIPGLSPSPSLLHKCMRCASKVILLYSEMYEAKQITWTRSYFQIMFTSGLSLMHSLAGNDARRGPTDSHTTQLRAESLKALSACRNVLYRLVREMPDVARFAYVFDALSRQVTGTNITAQASDASQNDSRLPYNSENNDRQPEIINTLGVTVPATLDSPDGSNPDGWFRDPETNTNMDINVAQATNGGHPTLPNDVSNLPFEAGGFESLDLPFDFDLSEYQGWQIFAQPDSVLGQMETGLGEYAWGYVPNDSTWMQYFA